MYTTTDSEGSTNATDCKPCPYPFTTNTAGSDGCPALDFALPVEAVTLVVWLGLFVLFFSMLLFCCRFNVVLCFRVLSFAQLLVATSTYNFISDVNYILTAKFYSTGLFASMVGSLGVVLLLFLFIAISRKLYPAMLFQTYHLFPGYYFISKHLYFITADSKGVIAVKDQLMMKPKTKETLERLEENDLSATLLTNGYSLESLEGKDKAALVETLYGFNSGPDWNPFNLSPAGHDSLPKFLVYVGVVLSLWTLQAFNILLFLIWPFLMFIRLPILFQSLL